MKSKKDSYQEEIIGGIYVKFSLEELTLALLETFVTNKVEDPTLPMKIISLDYNIRLVKKGDTEIPGVHVAEGSLQEYLLRFTCLSSLIETCIFECVEESKKKNSQN